jgi:hypothetical protein
VLLNVDEADRFVEAARRIGFGDAETDRWVSLGNAGLDEVDEEPSSDPFVPTGRDDCDRQFRDVLSDEAIAVGHLAEDPIPSRADRFVLFGNQSIVASHRPSSEVPRVAWIGEHLVTTHWRPPRCGLAKHRREKGEVLRSGRATSNVSHLAQSSSPAISRAVLFDPEQGVALGTSQSQEGPFIWHTSGGADWSAVASATGLRPPSCAD